jgi:aspartate kinase
LNAESVTIWKDVPGVMNADPRYFENASLLNQISYREAIELAFMAQRLFIQNITAFTEKGNSIIRKIIYQPIFKGTSVSKGVALEPIYLVLL